MSLRLFTTLLSKKKKELAEVESMVAELTAEADRLRADVDALNRSVEIAREAGIEDERDEATEEEEPEDPTATGNTTERVRQVLDQLPKRFSTSDVREQLKRTDPAFVERSHPTSLTHALKRMAKRGELIPAEPGGPNREARYERP